MEFLFAAALSQSIVPISAFPPTKADPCAAFATEQGADNRVVEARDLAELADIGRASYAPSESPFGLSPDGNWLAFQVRRANPDTNSYCQQMLVVAMDGTGPPRQVDAGGEFIRSDFELFGFTSVTAGSAKVITPRWSRDGQWIAYIKRVEGTNQVWRIDAKGERQAEQITALPDKIDDFRWLPDGSGVVVATRPALREATEEIAREAREGFLFGDRFWPQAASRPLPTGPVTTEYTTVTLTTGDSRPANARETALILPPKSTAAPEGARQVAEGPDSMLAWTAPVDRQALFGPTQLVMQSSDGSRQSCPASECADIVRMWWSRSEAALFAVRFTGAAYEQMALLRWDIDAPRPRNLVAGDAMLIGCGPAPGEIVCATETAVQPRRLVAFDSASGAERVIHDPNTDFASLALGKVERFRYRNSYGVEGFSDFVLPPDHQPGQRHPLVIVSYESLGLLRGGSGNEVPIQALAGRGYAVLSFHRPRSLPHVLVSSSHDEVLKRNRDNWIDRRHVHSALETALKKVLATGTVDDTRIGISGFSDGSSILQWALVNSDRYKAASLSSCCEGPYSYVLGSGPAFIRMSRKMGYKLFEPGMREYWKPLWLGLHAERLDVPLMIQVPDSEFRLALDVFELFSHAGKAIEMHVFNDETHIKWQPAHRLAVYDRNLDWFDFWLMQRVDCRSGKQEQYERWKKMPGAPQADELSCLDLPDPRPTSETNLP